MWLPLWSEGGGKNLPYVGLCLRWLQELDAAITLSVTEGYRWRCLADWFFRFIRA